MTVRIHGIHVVCKRVEFTVALCDRVLGSQLRCTFHDVVLWKRFTKASKLKK